MALTRSVRIFLNQRDKAHMNRRAAARAGEENVKVMEMRQSNGKVEDVKDAFEKARRGAGVFGTKAE